MVKKEILPIIFALPANSNPEIEDIGEKMKWFSDRWFVSAFKELECYTIDELLSFIDTIQTKTCDIKLSLTLEVFDVGNKK